MSNNAFKSSRTSKVPLKTSYVQTSKPQETFSNKGDILLEKVDSANDNETLASVNKSIVIPATIWCEFNAMLYASGHDYSYELLEEMLSSYNSKYKLQKNEDYNDRLSLLKKDELKKIKKKKEKKLK